MKALVVKSEFGGHGRGTVITDPQRIAEILAGEHAQHVAPTELEDTPPPATPAAPAAPADKKRK